MVHRTPNFHDHDDTNVIYDRSIDKSGRWIDMQIVCVHTCIYKHNEPISNFNV